MVAAPSLLHDAGAVRDQLDFLGVPDDEVIELQAVRTARGQQSVFVRARDVASVIASAPQAQGIYLIVNRVSAEATAKRPLGTWFPIRKGEGTTDQDIEARRVLVLDCDPDRPTDTSATDEQKSEARAFAERVRERVIECGVPPESIAWVDSGNGSQVWIALDDLPSDDATHDLVKRILRGEPESGGVHVDRSVHDAKRLFPVAGTMKRKGTDTTMHRMVTFDGPGLTIRLTADDLASFADRFAGPELERAESTPVRPRASGIYTTANAGDFHAEAASRGKLHGADDVECPGCGRHSTSMASIVESTELPGTFLVKCWSNTCAPHTIGEFGNEKAGVFTLVDAVAGWDGITPLEAARKLAPKSANDSTDIFGSLVPKIAALGSIGERLTTGFPTFDAACRGGLPMQRLLVVGGAPGAAKTTTVAQWAHRWAKQGIPVAFLAADEEAEGILTRWGQIEGLDLDAIEAGNDATKAALTASIAGLPLILVDSEEEEAAITIERVSSELRKRRGAGVSSVLIVDSLQTVKAVGGEAVDSPRERINVGIAAARVAAKRDGHLVIVTSELARAAYRGDTEINPLAAFKESGGIEYGFGAAIVLRTVDGDPSLVDVSVPKNRIGRSATAKQPWRMKLDFARATLSEVGLPAGERGDYPWRAEALEESILEAVRAHDLFSVNGIVACLVSKGTKVRRQQILDSVRALKASGSLVQNKSTKHFEFNDVPPVDNDATH